jgi:hypothetical protein
MSEVGCSESEVWAAGALGLREARGEKGRFRWRWVVEPSGVRRQSPLRTVFPRRGANFLKRPAMHERSACSGFEREEWGVVKRRRLSLMADAADDRCREPG